MIRKVFKVAVGFVLGTLVLLAVAIYFSKFYLEQQQELASAGNFEGAMEAVRLSARLNPFDPAPLAAEASLLQQRGQAEEAAGSLEEAIERDPANFNNYVSLGNLQLNQLNNPQQAAERYRQALDRVPKGTNIRSNLAIAMTRAGDLEGAKWEYEKLREMDRMSQQDLYNLGRIYVRTGEPEKGVEVLEEAREKARARLENPSSESQRTQRESFVRSLDLAIADAYVAQGQYDQARTVLESSDSEQAPAIIELLNIDPEEYRQTVLDSEI